MRSQHGNFFAAQRRRHIEQTRKRWFGKNWKKSLARLVATQGYENVAVALDEIATQVVALPDWLRRRRGLTP